MSVGAFRFTGKSKKTLLWEANFLQKKHQPQLQGSPPLFEEPPLQFNMPVLTDNRLDDLYDEMEILGFTLSNPFAMVDDDPANYVAAKDLEKHLHKTITVLVILLPAKATGMGFSETKNGNPFKDCHFGSHVGTTTESSNLLTEDIAAIVNY